MTDPAPSVLVSRTGAVTTVTINRPERRNSVDVELCKALHDSLLDISASDASVVIMRGAGTDFCVGANLRGTPPEGPAPTFALLEPLYHSATLLHSMPQITIAAIDGGCAGAGLGWASACDFRFASHGAKFSTAFLNVGVSGDMGLAWTLTRIVGASRAREMLLFPEKFGASEAKEFGLVTRLFDRDVLHNEVAKLANSLAERSPLALRMHKANLLSAEDLGIKAYIDIESARHVHTANGITHWSRTPSPGSPQETE